MIDVVKKRIEELADCNENYRCDFVREGEEYSSSVSYSVTTEDLDVSFSECIDITEEKSIFFGTVTMLETKEELTDDLTLLLDIINHYENLFEIFTDEKCEKLDVANSISFDEFWDILNSADNDEVALLFYGKATEIMFKYLPAIKGLAEGECSFEDAVKFVVMQNLDTEES